MRTKTIYHTHTHNQQSNYIRIFIIRMCVECVCSVCVWHDGKICILKQWHPINYEHKNVSEHFMHYSCVTGRFVLLSNNNNGIKKKWDAHIHNTGSRIRKWLKYLATWFCFSFFYFFYIFGMDEFYLMLGWFYLLLYFQCL